VFFDQHLSGCPLLHDQLHAGVFILFHLSDESVAALRDGFDVGFSVEGLSHCAPQKRNVLGEAAFFHKAIRPQHLHQLVLGDHVSSVFDENQKRIHHLRSERYRFVAPLQQALGGI
jgi:hypothetical protein